MKYHVEMGHLAKYGAFRVNRDQVMDLETWFKIHTNVSNFDNASLRSMAVLSSRAHERRSREIRARSARERPAFIT